MWITSQLETMHHDKGKENTGVTSGESVYLKMKLMNLCVELQFHQKQVHPGIDSQSSGTDR